jgi:hypothetical protein
MGSRLLFTNEIIFQASKRRDQDRAPESVARSRSEARGLTKVFSSDLRKRCNHTDTSQDMPTRSIQYSSDLINKNRMNKDFLLFFISLKKILF